MKAAVGEILDDVRGAVMRAAATVAPYETLVERIAARLAREEAVGLLPVLNATGVLPHTNLGRAPLAAEAPAFVRALSVNAALLLSSHASSRITGFVTDLTSSDLAVSGRRTAIPVIEDHGTGALIGIGAA